MQHTILEDGTGCEMVLLAFVQDRTCWTSPPRVSRASPGYGFCAHHGGLLFLAVGHPHFKRVTEYLRPHVIRVITKAVIAPTSLDGLLLRLLQSTETS